MIKNLKIQLLIPFFALLLITSCQEEKVEITPIDESESLAPNSELTNLMFATSFKDGSADNVIDGASCLSVELPVTVNLNGLKITVDSKDDFKVIEAVFKKFEDDDDDLDIVFPITIIRSNYDEIVLQNRDALEALAKECKGENEADDDIECVDFKFPISFSIYDAQFQIIDVIPVETDKQLYQFIQRVKNSEVFASLNFPVTMVLFDGTSVEANNNIELAEIINEAKDACDEDDDYDFGDDDFTKESLDTLLTECAWDFNEFIRDGEDLTLEYKDYKMEFKADGVVNILTPQYDVHETGTWSTRSTNNGVLLKTTFNNNAGFDFEWLVYDLESDEIKLLKSEGNFLKLEKNCNPIVNTNQRIENYLKTCLWRVDSLAVNGITKTKDYIGTPLKFYDDKVVKLRVKGELIVGSYTIENINSAHILKFNLEGKPDLNLEWYVATLKENFIKFENDINVMLLEQHCPDKKDDDLDYADGILLGGKWEVSNYDDGIVNGDFNTENFALYTVEFFENGKIVVINPNFGESKGSWLSYRDDELRLDLNFEALPFSEFNLRWKITEVSPNRIELRLYKANGNLDKVLMLVKKP